MSEIVSGAIIHTPHECDAAKRIEATFVHLLTYFVYGDMSLNNFRQKLFYLHDLCQCNNIWNDEIKLYQHYEHMPKWVYHIVLRFWDEDHRRKLIEYRKYSDEESKQYWNYMSGLCEGILLQYPENLEILKNEEDKNDSSEEVIVLRDISREQAKVEIKELFASGQTFYFSDIVEKLKLDLSLVVELCLELEKEGAIEDYE